MLVATRKPELPTGTGNFQEQAEIPGGSRHGPGAGLVCWLRRAAGDGALLLGLGRGEQGQGNKLATSTARRETAELPLLATEFPR